MPKDLGDWAGTAEFVLGANFAGKDLKDVSVVDKARAQDRNMAIACRQGLGTLIAKLGEQVPLSLSTPASRISWGAATSRWKRLRARSPPAPPSSRCRAMCWRRAISNSRPKFRSARSMPRPKLSLGSYDRIALQMPGNPLGLARDDIIIEQSNSTRTALLYRQHGSIVAVFDRCRGLVRPRSVRAGREGHGGLCDGVADQAVRQRSRGRGEEIERDPLERRALCARRDVGGRTGRASVAQNPDRADRLHVSRRRSHP